MKTAYSFQKSLFNLYLNSVGVDKYKSSDGQIKLVVTHATKGDTKITRTFDNEDAYEIWLDSVVDDNDYYYNTANALNSVLHALGY